MFDSISKLLSKGLEVIFPDRAKQDEAKAALLNAQMAGELKQLEAELQIERDLIAARGAAVVAEAKGESWVQRNWRGTTMLLLTSYIGLIVMGWAHGDHPESVIIEIINLIKIGLGGFVIGRTVEKGIGIAGDKWGPGAAKAVA